MQVNQIDVGAEIQLAAAQFAHRQNAESADCARAFTQKSSREIERRADAFVGQLRHRLRRLADAQPVEQIGNRNLHHHAAHKSPELRGCRLPVRRIDAIAFRAHCGD